MAGPKKSGQKPQQQQAPAPKAEEVKVVEEVKVEADAKKKKKKKTKGDDAAESSQPVTTEPVDEGWEEVKDSKKEKRNARVERKRLLEAESKAETSEDDYAVVNVPTQSSKSDEKNEPAAKGKVKGAAKPAKKKKVASKPADVKKPASAAELVKLITDILENTPSRTQHVPAIGDRIQTLTKQVWSKTYKSQFGSIKDFITSQKDAFHVDESERVSLQKDIQARNAAKAAAQQQAAAKKAAKKEQQKKAPAKEKPRHDHHGAAASDASDITSLVLKFGLVLALLGGLGFFTAVWVNGGDLKSLGLRN